MLLGASSIIETKVQMIMAKVSASARAGASKVQHALRGFSHSLFSTYGGTCIQDTR